MTKRSVTHGTFSIEHSYDVPPKRAFAAWATPEAKMSWFGGPAGWERTAYELDFRVGGREISRGGPKGGTVHAYDALYYDIIENERIVYAYNMHLDDQQISVSLTTVEFIPAGTGTRLVLTEQDVFLDGYDNAGQREQGTKGLLANLDAALKKQMANI